MSGGRKIVTAVLLSLAAFSIAVLLLPAARDYAALVGYIVFYESRHPEAISWDAKNAYLKCPGAISDPRQWPEAGHDACAAMYLCVNEGALSPNQMKSLYDRIRNTAGCQKPD